jgi:hypothetical protein
MRYDRPPADSRVLKLLRLDSSLTFPARCLPAHPRDRIKERVFRAGCAEGLPYAHQQTSLYIKYKIATTGADRNTIETVIATG